MSGPRVSVVLNCYNHEPYVAEAIDSVLAQSLADFELILIDNGSTDGSRAVFDRYSDARIRRFDFECNESLSRRLNQGVAAARGEFVSILYSDDLMLPDKLERQVAMFDSLRAETGVVYAPALGFDQFTGAVWTERSYALSGSILDAMIDRHFEGPIDMCSPLTRTEAYRANRWHEDLFGDGEAVFLRIARQWQFHFDPRPVVRLRNHDGNLGKAIRYNSDMHLEIVRRMEEEGGLPDSIRRGLDRHRARYAVNSAWSFVRLGGRDRGWAFAKLRQAVRDNPRSIAAPRFLATGLLAAAPAPLAKAVNRLGDRLRPGGKTKALVDSY